MRHPDRSDSRLRRGFTLVELVIVIAIIGLITAVISNSVESLLPGERLNTSIRVLSADLMGVRSEAISKGMEYRLIYDIDGDRYRTATPFQVGGGGRLISERDDEYDSGDRYYTPWTHLNKGVEFSVVFVAGVPYTQGEVYVRFDPLGTASDHSVVLKQPQFDSYFTIEVLPLTGLIRMHEGEYVREEPQDGDFD